MRENTNLTYYQRNRDVILNRSKDYYENNKERLKKQARDKYRNLSEEVKHKKKRIWNKWTLQYVCRGEKRLKEYQKNYREAKKSQYIIIK